MGDVMKTAEKSETALKKGGGRWIDIEGEMALGRLVPPRSAGGLLD